jgi:hypothetical protein
MCRSRHNDDGLYKPCVVGDDYDNRQAIEPPALPADIAALNTPAEQIELAKKYLKVLAGELPVDAVGNFAESAQWVLTGIEVFPEIYRDGESLRDPFRGHRHQINVDSLEDLFKQEKFYTSGGHKNIRENSVGIAMAIADVDDQVNPIAVLWRYRFISAPVGNLVQYPVNKTMAYHDDIANFMRFDMSEDELKESRQGRFRVRNSKNSHECGESWNKPSIIDEWIEKIPGLDGYGNRLEEEYHYYGANDKLKEYRKNTPLKAGYYNRFYSMNGLDASNRRHAMRSFGDDKLWVAKTSNKRIKSAKFGSEEYAFSYFIPLEAHIQSFFNGNFNPYGLEDVTPLYSRDQMQAMARGNSESSPLPGFNDRAFYYKNPSEVFSTPRDGDPADTIATSGYWFRCADGVARKHYVSGYGYFMPTFGVTKKAIRTRWPIYFAHFEGSEAYKYIEASRQEGDSALSLLIQNTISSLLNKKAIQELEQKH